MRDEFSAGEHYRLASKVDRHPDPGGCWTWTGTKDRTGYGQLRFRGKSHALAHRVAWELVAGAIPPGLVIGHVCDNPSCVRNDDVGVYEVNGRELPRRGHLWMGTQADNLWDMHRKGRGAVPAPPEGSTHHLSHLSGEEVDRIRALKREGATYKDLAARYGVYWGTIARITTRKTWKRRP